MKKIVTPVLVLLCAAALLAGCAMPSPYRPTEVKNVSIRICDVSPTGATLVIQDTNDTPYIYGEWYQVEQERNGDWYALDTVIDNYGFAALGYTPNGKGEIEFEIDWEWLYGKLPAGQYRLLKQVDRQYISVTFTLD